MKRSLLVIALFVVFGLAGSETYAADFSIDCDNTGCTPGIVTEFFDSTEPWYPLRTMTQKATITNSSEEPQYVGHGARNVYISPGANIAEVLDVEVVRQTDNSVMWVGSLQDLYDGNEIGLGTVLSGDTETYIYQITMRNVGNEYQGKSTQFDMDFGYYIPTPTLSISPTDTPAPTPTTTQAPTPTPDEDGNISQSTSDQGGGGGTTGQVLGAAQSNLFSPILQSVKSFFGVNPDTEDIDEPESNQKQQTLIGDENILGNQDNICENASWWLIIIPVYGISGIVMYGLGRKIKRLVRIVLYGAITLIAIVLLVYAVCSWLLAAILTAVVGIITQFLIESHAQE